MIWDWTGKNKNQQKKNEWMNEWKAPDVIESWKQIKKKKNEYQFYEKIVMGMDGWWYLFANQFQFK